MSYRLPRSKNAVRVTEHFVAIGPDGRIYKKLPPCDLRHNKHCPYYWECRPDLSCPEALPKSFYTADGKFQVLQ